MLNEESSLNRSERRQYLSTMGIQTWVPRVAALEEDSAPVATVPENERSIEQVQTPSSAVREEVEALTQNLSPAKEALTVASAPARTESQREPRFRLFSLLYPGQGMVVGDISIESEAQLSNSQHKLVSALVNSIGVPASERGHLSIFDWPFMQNQQLNQSRDAALTAVQAYLEAQVSDVTSRFVLIMGETASHFILPHEAELSLPRGKLWSLLEYPALITDSIDNLLTEPLRKKAAWQDVQPLCRLINSGG